MISCVPRRRFALLLGSLLPVLGPLVSCQRVAEFHGATMGTSYTVKYLGDHPVSEVRRAVDTALQEFNLVFSTYLADSEISRFNADRGGEEFPASPRLLEVVREALRIAALTDGAFDPTVMPLVRAWGFAPGDRSPAGDAEVERARQRVGWQKLQLTGGGVTRSAEGVELDLSAIAKGAGVDQVESVLVGRGIESFMVEIGGEVFCAGEKAPGLPWKIGVQDPANPPGSVSDIVPLRDQAMATSGTYRNWIDHDGERVHHILDPRSGRNATNRVVSVSVIAPTCMVADALATAFMVLGADAAERVVRAEPGVRALFLLAAEGGGLERREHGW